ncbi:reverse transcriptase domain-containing protein [Nocardioides zeae]|uniref:Reverse transcriptase domain-containing protein n=1 Tax=Nocardioides imazamoxiresistens TaxID=3231893 RepID=A0ABU3PTW1_9ACTN|nr:reverse transcriptase domain-containing protein [Nocardioides zeae]MDT9592631.1 reverse transcriptase domain-containing protein [Nocardioides zeae]
MTTSNPGRLFWTASTQKSLLHSLAVTVPTSQGVGLDGIHPASVDGWTTKHKRILAASVSKSLRTGHYRLTSYREGLASRGRGRHPRVFSIPTVRDRVALLALKSTLRSIYGIGGPEPPQRKMSRVIDAVDSGVYDYYLKMDIQDFFGSIRHETLISTVAQDVPVDPVIRFLERALRNSTVAFGERSRGLSSAPDGLPLGLPVSSQLAELYLRDFDRSTPPTIRYFRYVDDILVLSKRPVESQFDLLVGRLNRLGLTTHPLGTPGKCDSGKLSEGFDYLGYTLGQGAVRVTPAGMRKIENQLARLISQLGKAYRSTSGATDFRRLLWRLELTIGGCIVDGQARGWIRYYNRTTDLTSLGHLDALVRNLLRRYGLPGGTVTKLFTQAYWASRDNDRFRQFALDLDSVDAVAAREHLREHEEWTTSALAALNDLEAIAAFRRVVRRHVVDLEHDLEPAS